MTDAPAPKRSERSVGEIIARIKVIDAEISQKNAEIAKLNSDIARIEADIARNEAILARLDEAYQSGDFGRLALTLAEAQAEINRHRDDNFRHWPVQNHANDC